MPVNKIWVVAEAFEGKPLTITLELLTAARNLGSTVESFTWVGDIGQNLPGPVVGAAIAQQIQGGDGPDAILIPATYDGRDIAGRTSAKLDRPVLTNVVGLTEDGGTLVSEHAIFGGAQILKAKFT